MRPIAGVARKRTTAPTTRQTKTGRRSAPPTRTISLELLSSVGIAPIRQRFTLWPSRTSTAGPAITATLTLIKTTSITVAASDASSAPGTTKNATSIETISVLPAKITVRPAARFVVTAASKGDAPAASSSRKRETISRA